MADRRSPTWWGAPKRFDRPEHDRHISWLELFFDLVYVIAIARITHHLAQHLSWHAFAEYASLFTLIYWGWLNGSLYHDMHGQRGLRTQIMTLWQMMIIAALAIVTERYFQHHSRDMLVVFMVMQVYITYLWWSVGMYDKSHRRYNIAYTIFYLLSLALMGLCLVLPQYAWAYVIPFILVANYTPPFISQRLLRRNKLDLSMSASMFERMGLFTIIVFGEVVLGVVNGISEHYNNSFRGWLQFAVALGIVFSLWWMFFTLVGNREVKKGFRHASLLEILYIPALMCLGLIAAALPPIFSGEETQLDIRLLIAGGIAGFLGCMALMQSLLDYPKTMASFKKPLVISLLLTAIVILFTIWWMPGTNPLYHLLLLCALLVAEIGYLNWRYFHLQGHDPESVKSVSG